MRHLFEGHAAFHEDHLHCLGMGQGCSGVCIQWLDQDAHALLGETRPNEGSGIRNGEQSSLDSNAARYQMLAQLDNAFFSLIGGHELGKDLPLCHLLEAAKGIGFNSCGGR